MRLATFLVASLALVASAAAQPAASSEAEVQAARTIAQSMTSRLLTRDLVDAAIVSRVPELRQGILEDPFYEALRADTKQSLTAYLDTLPDIFRELIAEQMSLIAVDFERRLIDRFTEEELTNLATIVSEPVFQDTVAQSIQAYARDGVFNADSIPEAQRAELERLFADRMDRPMARMWDVNRVLAESSAAVQLETRPAFERRFLAGFCAALNDECPPHVQSALAAD